MTRVLPTTVVVLALAVSGGASAGDEAQYVGAAVCLSCHSQDAGVPWIGTAHARSHLVLGTGYEEMVLDNQHRMVDVGHGRVIAEAAERLQAETDCLSCHATAAGVPESQRADSFFVADGVQCEACHGPGGKHAAVHNDGTADASVSESTMAATLGACQRCHRLKPSHAVLKVEPFEAEAAWRRIAHGVRHD